MMFNPRPIFIMRYRLFTRRELLRNRFCFFGLSVVSAHIHLSTERGNHAKNKKNEMGGGF